MWPFQLLRNNKADRILQWLINMVLNLKQWTYPTAPGCLKSTQG